ncbi:MAG: hypothetical protein ACTSU5_02745 [Promethearchaeota archaeon]
MRELKNEKEWREFREATPALVLYSTPTCSPCVALKKVVDANLSKLREVAPGLGVAWVNCDTIPDQTAAIKYVPYVTLVVDGGEFELVNCLVSPEELAERIQGVLDGGGTQSIVGEPAPPPEPNLFEALVEEFRRQFSGEDD